MFQHKYSSGVGQITRWHPTNSLFETLGEYSFVDEYFDKNVGRVCVMDEYLPEKCGEYSSVGRVSSQHGASIPTAYRRIPCQERGANSRRFASVRQIYSYSCRM